MAPIHEIPTPCPERVFHIEPGSETDWRYGISTQDVPPFALQYSRYDRVCQSEEEWYQAFTMDHEYSIT